MIEFTSGDILKDEAEAIVNTVNCVGIMGRGIALQFKNAWPENFKAYQTACKRNEVQPGRMFMFEVGQLTSPRWIVNFPTKRHWKGKSRMEDIDAGLQALAAEIRLRGIRSIAIPPLGSGLGGLDWAQVRLRIEALAAQLPEVSVRVYEPNGAPPAATMRHVRDVPAMTTGRAALVGLMHPADGQASDAVECRRNDATVQAAVLVMADQFIAHREAERRPGRVERADLETEQFVEAHALFKHVADRVIDANLFGGRAAGQLLVREVSGHRGSNGQTRPPL